MPGPVNHTSDRLPENQQVSNPADPSSSAWAPPASTLCVRFNSDVLLYFIYFFCCYVYKKYCFQTKCILLINLLVRNKLLGGRGNAGVGGMHHLQTGTLAGGVSLVPCLFLLALNPALPTAGPGDAQPCQLGEVTQSQGGAAFPSAGRWLCRLLPNVIWPTWCPLCGTAFRELYPLLS